VTLRETPNELEKEGSVLKALSEEEGKCGGGKMGGQEISLTNDSHVKEEM